MKPLGTPCPPGSSLCLRVCPKADPRGCRGCWDRSGCPRAKGLDVSLVQRVGFAASVGSAFVLGGCSWEPPFVLRGCAGGVGKASVARGRSSGTKSRAACGEGCCRS